MAESFPSLRRSILEGSDQLPDNFCEPCFEASNKIKAVAGYCRDCDESLCIECFTSHCGLKLFRSHQLVDKSTRPKTKSAPPTKPLNVTEECHLHHGEKLQAYCCSHSLFICKVCLTIDHETCHTEEISKLAQNINVSQDLNNVNQKLSTLKKGFKDNQSKTEANKEVIQNNHGNALNEMKKLQDDFDKLMTITENQADIAKAEEFSKIKKVSATCDVVIEQINKLSTRLETLEKTNANESLFIAMKRAENQLQSLEEKLDQLDKDNTIREYRFEPDEKMKAMLNDLQVLGQLSYVKSDQKAKGPKHVKDVPVTSSSDQAIDIFGSILLPNKTILITDIVNHQLKLIDTNQDKIISEIQLSGQPFDVTKVKADEAAVTVNEPYLIQFISVTQDSMSKVREFKVDGECNGLVYNERDETLIVCFVDPPKVKILDMAGTEMKCIEHDSNGGQLFDTPYYVALTPDMTNFYVTDLETDSVTLLSLNGDVEVVYKDKSGKRQYLYGLCVHKSGIVYVVGCDSNTVHELDPESGEFRVVLEEKDGLDGPMSINYCEMEDRIYIGMWNTSVLKVFQMK